MKVYLNEISGLWQAIVSMYMSKRSWTREKEEEILGLYECCYDRNGLNYTWRREDVEYPEMLEFKNMMDKLFKWAPKHITMTRFLDFSFTVEGLHRGAQDDFDAHAKRLENRNKELEEKLQEKSQEKFAEPFKQSDLLGFMVDRTLDESTTKEELKGIASVIGFINGIPNQLYAIFPEV